MIADIVSIAPRARVLVGIIALAGCGAHASAPPGLDPAVDTAVDTCAQVADAVVAIARQGAASAPDDQPIARATAQRCTDDAWPAPARACVVAAKGEAELGGCDARFTGDQARDLRRAIWTLRDQRTAAGLRARMCACTEPSCAQGVHADIAAARADMATRYGEPVVPGAVLDVLVEAQRCETAVAPAPPAYPSTTVPECDAYLAEMTRFGQCPQIPQATRDAITASIAQVQQGWASLRDPNTPAEAKRAAGDACKQGVDALKQSATAMGCAGF
jgi:hypothetical protein